MHTEVAVTLGLMLGRGQPTGYINVGDCLHVRGISMASSRVVYGAMYIPRMSEQRELRRCEESPRHVWCALTGVRCVEMNH